MPAGRLPVWKLPEGKSLDDTVCLALAGDADVYGLVGITEYEPRDFRVGVDTEKMAVVKNSILELFKLDSRGVFDNDVLEYGLKKIQESDAYDAAVQRRSSSSEKSRNGYVTETGYVLRIMLGHAKVRAKLAANTLQKTPGATLSETLHPLWLQEVYKLMETSIGEAGRPKSKSHGKNAPLTKRPCVFVNYRPFFEQQEAADSSDSESSGHEPMDPLQEMVNDMAVVAKEYDSNSCKAIIRFSNGFQLPATTYEETDTGFLRAVWPATGEVLQLEVPNVQLVDGKIKPDCPVPQMSWMVLLALRLSM